MADVITKTCDVCGRAKGETNYWFVGVTRSGFEGIIFQPAETVEQPRRSDYTYEDLCGDACAVKRFARYLESLSAIERVS